MIQSYLDIKSREDIEDFDVREKFREKILPLVTELHRICDEIGIPYFFAATLSSYMDDQAGDTEPHGHIYGVNGNLSPIRDATMYVALLAISSVNISDLGYRITDYLSKDPLAIPSLIAALEKNEVLVSGVTPHSGGVPHLH